MALYNHGNRYKSTKKATRNRSPCNLPCTDTLEADGAAGACVSAGATLGALVGVDAVDVALRDSANGTFVNASATGNTVVTNYVSHFMNKLKIKK